MFQSWRKLIEEELSGRQAFRYADRIAQYHRIQASPGYRQAAREVIELLKRDHVDAELISYPAQYGERFLSHFSFQEWKCESAELWVEGPNRRRIARFEEEEISVIQRSISTGLEGVKAELVVIENAEDEKSYIGLDLEGKIALVRGNQFIVHALAVEKYKCRGLIFDNLAEFRPIRSRKDMPDARQYTSYWWHQQEEVKSFGFVVSPRISEELRQLAKTQTVTLQASVKSELYDGQFENIEYFIPGKQDKEILIVSHLCHPYPGGQDNASGPGTLMEVMRTLTRLINKGLLPKPDLGIRFLMMPEMTGTCAYFHLHPERITKTVAALNLDMVGADQSKGGGPLCIEQPPLSTPTFVDRFVYSLVSDLSKNTSTFTGTTEYSTTHYEKTRFSGGSDHYIISDPTIGIPCPMLIQWPDKNYHTTLDSTTHLDPNMMKLVGTVAALYSYGLANGEEMDWMAYASNHSDEISSYLIDSKKWLMNRNFSKETIKQALSFFIGYEEAAFLQLEEYARLRGFTRLLEHTKVLKDFNTRQTSLVTEMAEYELSFKQHPSEVDEIEDWMNRVYVRKYKGPIRLGDEVKQLTKDERLHWLKEIEPSVPSGYSDFLFYWMNGERTMEEILELTKYETSQYYPDYAKKLMEICLSLHIITERRKGT
ncbi:DUF4910 domain-containing protein [Bacillus salitolerans]|uniref:DUF4910 domain-containing protein n=1 Tax=Bacillus salitolerans TaxID=1437434 RepID=A0ABW4LXA8_9BACI